MRKVCKQWKQGNTRREKYLELKKNARRAIKLTGKDILKRDPEQYSKM